MLLRIKGQSVQGIVTQPGWQGLLEQCQQIKTWLMVSSSCPQVLYHEFGMLRKMVCGPHLGAQVTIP